MLYKTILPRIFSFKNEGNVINLEDPNPNFTAQQVLNFFSDNYPILTTAKIDGPVIETDTVKYTFTTNIGTKG